MSEIVCRGKADCYWIEGFYVCLKGKEHRIYDGYAETDCGDYYPDYWKVDPKTVGQFTGRVDKNGKKVFEDDILRVIVDGQNWGIGVVQWCDHDQCFSLFVIPDSSHRLMDFGDLGLPEYYEIIGNIHDNPELIKEDS